MAINLSKGQNINLSKEVPGLKKLKLGLSWDTSKFESNGKFDLDVSLFCLEKDEQGPIMKRQEDFVFYNNKISADGSIVHNGDNRTGDKDGDDETIDIDLTKIDSRIKEISVIVTIDDAITKRQNFGMVENASIKLYNTETGEVIGKYDLTEVFSTETAVQFGSLYIFEGEWKFKAVGAGFSVGLNAFIEQYRFQS